MKLQRFIYPKIKDGKIGEEIKITEPKIIHQIKNVFRMKAEGVFILCDGNYKNYLVKIKNIDKAEIEILVEEINNLPKDAKEIYVFVSLIKPNIFDDVFLHLVEVGATKIIPIISARTQKRNLRTERLEEIIKEATEQSGRGKLAELLPVMDFAEALDFAQKENLEILIFHTKENKNKPAKNKKDFGLFVGPEGGFIDEEISLAESVGAQNIFLGENILRAETASVVATYLAKNNLL